MKRVILVALVFLAACSHSAKKETAPLPLSPPQAASLDNGCVEATPDTVDQVGSIHTFPPRDSRAVYAVAIAPSFVCPGGTIRVAVRVINPTNKTITVTPSLIITRPSNYLDCCDAITVPAHGAKTITRTLVIPASTPIGSHQIRFRDYLSGDPYADQEARLLVKKA